MGKPKYVDCWTYPKPVLDEKLGEIKTDVSAVTGQVDILTGNVETLSENMADVYSSSSTYSVGDLCIYENELYRCTTAIATAEEWTAGHWTQTTIADTFDSLSGEVETLSETAETINANISDEYDSTATYSVGDLCIYENELYRCTTAIATAEEWTAGHWTATTIADEISEITEIVTIPLEINTDIGVTGSGKVVVYGRIATINACFNLTTAGEWILCGWIPGKATGIYADYLPGEQKWLSCDVRTASTTDTSEASINTSGEILISTGLTGKDLKVSGTWITKN